MNNNIEVTAYFSKQLKRLSKKYPSLKAEFSLVNSLRESPEQGTPIGKTVLKYDLP